MFTSLSSELTCSQSPKPRRFFDMQRDQERKKQRQENNQNQVFKKYNLYIPNSVRCPFELSPIESFMGDQVPFAAALHKIRSRCLPTKINFDSDDFQWLDTDQLNNSSGESSSKKDGPREIDNYLFMYFRIRMEHYVVTIGSIQSSKDQTYFTDENLDKWTHKYRFRIHKTAPLIRCMAAFANRMGLVGDNNIVYCADGFYGDSVTGTVRSKNGIPINRLLPTNTCYAVGLRSGSNIFVSRMTDLNRKNAFAQLQADLLQDGEPEAVVEQATPGAETGM